MISKSKDSRYYFISNKSEARIILSKSIWAFFIMLFSFIAALASPVVAISVDTGMNPGKSLFGIRNGWSFPAWSCPCRCGSALPFHAV